MAQKAETAKDVNEKIEVRQSGGNVFADLDLANAEELNAKAQIAYGICKILDDRRLTQQKAAALLGVDQPKISALRRGRLDGFSTDRLFRFLNALNRNVEIVIRPASSTKKPGTIRVLARA